MLRCSPVPSPTPNLPPPPLTHAQPPLSIRHDVDVAGIDAGAWDALAGDAPLASHAFVMALHASGAASPATGWAPRYCTAWRGRTLVGAMPCYGKSHSWGEYVFDWAWADAFRRHRRRYYPKLVAAIPFTPVTGPRLLAREGDAATRRALLDAALSRVAVGEYSSLHVLFTGEADTRACVDAGMMERNGVQFHWRNQGWRDFDDFLAAMSHDKRKRIRQERRKLAALGLRFERRAGRDIREQDWDLFFRCYVDTYRRHGATPYLPRAFFEQLAATMPDALLMAIGSRDGRPIAAAFDVASRDALWGRYWGTLEYVPGLHFEACYYQGIEHAIERGLSRFEGGAQGAHKLARGLMPVVTHSAHAIADPDFARAIAAFCDEERADVAHAEGELGEASPFKADRLDSP